MELTVVTTTFGLEAVARILWAERHRAVAIPFLLWPAAFPTQCHLNVANFIACNRGSRPALGWFVQPAPGATFFKPHAVVERPDGILIDITPNALRVAFLRRVSGDRTVAQGAFVCAVECELLNFEPFARRPAPHSGRSAKRPKTNRSQEFPQSASSAVFGYAAHETFRIEPRCLA
jgi:hypothetical protein